MSSETTTAISLLDRLSAGEITSESIVRDLLERSDGARRVPPIREPVDIPLDGRPKPKTADSIDRPWQREMIFQHE